MKDSVAAGFQGRWVTVVPGSEGKRFPVREPCLAVDVMYVGAGDHCLVSSYWVCLLRTRRTPALIPLPTISRRKEWPVAP